MNLSLLEAVLMVAFVFIAGAATGVLLEQTAGGTGKLICMTPGGEAAVERATGVKFRDGYVRWHNNDTKQNFVFNGMCMLRST